MTKEGFHKKHEIFTKAAYDNPGILPERYVFILTNLCNLKCSFCFQARDFRKESMTSLDWIDFTKQLPSYARVTFCGGEPLLFPGFKEVFSYSAERFDCNLISNGVLLTEEKINFLLSFSKFRVLSLSIDNIGNSLRGLTSWQWSHLKDMIGYFIKRKKKIKSKCVLDVKTMVLDENAESLFKLYKYFVEKLNIDTHVFQFLKGSPIQHSDCMFSFRDITKKSKAPVYKKFDLIKKQMKLVRQFNLQKKRRFSFLHPAVDSLVSEEPFSKIDYLNESSHIKERYLPCKFPWSSVHINVDGVLFPCLSISMGNVKGTPLKEIINGRNLVRFKNLIKDRGTFEACNRCGWLRPE